MPSLRVLVRSEMQTAYNIMFQELYHFIHPKILYNHLLKKKIMN